MNILSNFFVIYHPSNLFLIFFMGCLVHFFHLCTLVSIGAEGAQRIRLGLRHLMNLYNGAEVTTTRKTSVNNPVETSVGRDIVRHVPVKLKTFQAKRVARKRAGLLVGYICSGSAT